MPLEKPKKAHVLPQFASTVRPVSPKSPIQGAWIAFLGFGHTWTPTGHPNQRLGAFWERGSSKTRRAQGAGAGNRGAGRRREGVGGGF